MKLDAEYGACTMPHGCKGGGPACCDAYKTLWQGLDPVAMAHPDLVGYRRLGQAMEYLARLDYREFGRAVFTALAFFHPSAQKMCGKLHPITDSKDRDAKIKYGGRYQRRPIVIYACRPAGHDYALGGHLSYLFYIKVKRVYLTIDLRLPDPPCYQLSGLGTEIKDQYPLAVYIFHH